jgi:hypothetical protein
MPEAALALPDDIIGWMIDELVVLTEDREQFVNALNSRATIVVLA